MSTPYKNITRAFVRVTNSGDNTVVAAVATKRIRVLAAILGAGGSAQDFQFTSSTTSNISGIMDLSQVTIVLPYNPYGWWETVAGELLGCNLSTADATTIWVMTVAVPEEGT